MAEIISAEARLAERLSPKIVIAGAPNVGKTSLLRTVENPQRTLLVNLAGEDLCVRDVPVSEVRLEGWSEIRNLACLIGGANPAHEASEPYSAAHYGHCVQWADACGLSLDGVELVFIDTLSHVGHEAWRVSESDPRTITDKGKHDQWAAYRIVANHLTQWIKQLQRARNTDVVMTCVMNERTDDVGRISYELQLPGRKSENAVREVIDEILVMDWVKGSAVPRLITKQQNPYGYPAKDRRGVLLPEEEPHLGRILRKIRGEV